MAAKKAAKKPAKKIAKRKAAPKIKDPVFETVKIERDKGITFLVMNRGGQGLQRRPGYPALFPGHGR